MRRVMGTSPVELARQHQDALHGIPLSLIDATNQGVVPVLGHSGWLPRDGPQPCRLAAECRSSLQRGFDAAREPRSVLAGMRELGPWPEGVAREDLLARRQVQGSAASTRLRAQEPQVSPSPPRGGRADDLDASLPKSFAPPANTGQAAKQFAKAEVIKFRDELQFVPGSVCTRDGQDASTQATQAQSPVTPQGANAQDQSVLE